MKRSSFTLPVMALLGVMLVSLPINASAQGQGVATAPGQQPPVDATSPSISGTSVDGQTLTADPGDWSGVAVTYTYQWQRCDTSGDGCSSVDGAVDSTYGLGSNDVGSTLRVVVTASNKNGSVSAESEVSAVVGPGPAPAPNPPDTTSTTTTTTTTPTPPPASAPNTGIGVIRLGGGAGTADNWGTLTNTDKYSVMVVGQADALQAGQLPGRALMWGCGVNIGDAPGWSTTCGVPWTVAVANNWLLKDANGNYVPYGDGYTYLADIGNPSYQQAWITAMNSIMSSEPGIDGVMIDNISGSLITASPKYPDSASYRAAVKSFMDAVGPALRAKGWYVAVNAHMTDTTTQGWSTSFGNQCDGSQYLWWYQQLAPDINGLVDEYWLMNWDSSGSLRLGGTAACNQNWDGWQRLVGAAEAMGKDFIPVTSGTSDAAGVNKSTFLKASFLLDYNGGTSAFIYSAGGLGNYSTTADNWMNGAAWTLDIGQASGAKYQVGVGWRRNFSGGTFLIDPSPTTSQTFDLGGSYVLPSGSSTTSVTLTPGSALILRASST
jgi:hypothetical protein